MVAIMPQHVNRNVTRAWLVASLVMIRVGAAQAADIRIQIENGSGVAYAQLHAADATDWDSPLQQERSEQQPLLFHDVPPGRYAVQLFVDQNANGQLDVTRRGLPSEPVGFSNNPRLLMGKPTPSGSAFDHGDTDSLVQIELRRGKPRRNKDEPEGSER